MYASDSGRYDMQVPRRTAEAENAGQLHLARAERLILLLIDGRRSVYDLVKLVRKSNAEVRDTLTRLVTLGLVTFS
jgi:hypothetical protein